MQKLVAKLSLDRTVYLLLATALGGFCLFVLISLLVRNGLTLSLDDFILTSLRSSTDLSTPIGPKQLLTIARDITALGDATVLTIVTTMTLGYCLLTRYYAAFFMVFVSVNGANLSMLILKLIFHRSRPELVPHLVDTTLSSFPSGHAMMSAVVYLTIAAILARVEPRRKVKIYLIAVFACLSLVIGCSRIYLGVHYPSDVIAGWLAGISAGTFFAAVVMIANKRLKSTVV